MKKYFIAGLLFFQHAFCQAQCDTSQLPIVFVHGFMGSGDNWAIQVQRFSSNGFCENRLFVFDWNSLGGGQNTTSASLDSFINTVLEKTRSRKINLVGHSAGGGVCYHYLKDSLHALKVAHYAHLASMKMGKPAGNSGEVPTLNIYSKDDKVVAGGADIPGAVNIQQTGNDHMQVATCDSTFISLYQFFTGKKKNADPRIIPLNGKSCFMGGKAVMLAENTPLSADSFRVNLFDPKSGKVLNPASNKTKGNFMEWTRFGKDGSFGFNLQNNSYTEFEVRPSKGRTLFYYFEPLVRNNKNIYLRALPASGMAAAMLGKIPEDDHQSVLVIFTSNAAVIAGRDTLAIDSVPLSLPALAPAKKTAIATFVYDDGDGITSGKALRSMSMAPFISGVDVFLEAGDQKTMRVYYNGRSMVLPRRKSSEGIMIAVFN